MGNIFYGFGILILLSCFMAIINFKKFYFVKEWFVKYKEITGKNPKADDFRSKKDLILHTNRNILISIELIWVMIGLSSSNWIIFLLIISLGVMLNVIFNKIKFTLIGKIISFKFLMMRTLLYILMITNHFYLHLDLTESINQLF